MSVDVAKAKERLLEMKEDLQRQLREASQQNNDIGKDGIQDAADEASNDNLRNLMYEISDKLVRRLRQVDYALERIGKDDYEYCIECGAPIGQQRLEYRPYAVYCRDCKEELESTGGLS